MRDICKTKKEDDIKEEAAQGCKTDDRYCIVDIEDKCAMSQRPIDFIYKRSTDSFVLDSYKSNA